MLNVGGEAVQQRFVPLSVPVLVVVLFLLLLAASAHAGRPRNSAALLKGIGTNDILLTNPAGGELCAVGSNLRQGTLTAELSKVGDPFFIVPPLTLADREETQACFDVPYFVTDRAEFELTLKRNDREANHFAGQEDVHDRVFIRSSGSVPYASEEAWVEYMIFGWSYQCDAAACNCTPLDFDVFFEIPTTWGQGAWDLEDGFGRVHADADREFGAATAPPWTSATTTISGIDRKGNGALLYNGLFWMDEELDDPEANAWLAGDVIAGGVSYDFCSVVPSHIDCPRVQGPLSDRYVVHLVGAFYSGGVEVVPTPTSGFRAITDPPLSDGTAKGFIFVSDNAADGTRSRPEDMGNCVGHMLTGVENGWWGPEQPPGDVGAPNLLTHELLGHGLTLQTHPDCDDPALDGTIMSCGSTRRGFQLGAPPLSSDQATTFAVDSPYTH